MYINECNSNNITYSIDMIRLKTYLTYTNFSEIEFRFNTVWKDYVCKKYNTPKMSDFYYNYVIEIEEGKSFWFGFMHNTEKRQVSERAEYNFTIEFNPNKLKDNKVIMYLLSLSGEWFLKSYDLACDLKINILDLIVDSSGRLEMKTISRKYDDKTIYFGKGDGRVKIYNKKKESNLNILGDLTRVEISRQVDDFDIRDVKFLKFGKFFPIIYLNNYVYSFSDYDSKNSTLLAILYAIQNGYPIKNLSRSYKQRIRNLLEGGYKILFDESSATGALRKTIFYYFIKNPRVIFK